MKLLENPHRGGDALTFGIPFPSIAAEKVADLLGQCPVAAPTPLVDAHELAIAAGIQNLWVKDERTRMGLGSFKALGAAYVISRQAYDASSPPNETTLVGRTYVTASAGNHGMSVAAGARLFGAQAVVYIAQTVPETFAQRLRAKGCDVRREGKDYAASMATAQLASEENGWTLLSDSSWVGYVDIPHLLMEGYLQIPHEISTQIPATPTHIILQAGVGGLAGSVAAYARELWGDDPKIIVVEPDAAPALFESIKAGHAVETRGPDSVMGRLDCKEPSLIALNGLARDADVFVTVTDTEVVETLPVLDGAGLGTTASGAAGAALALIKSAHAPLGITQNSRVLVIVSEEPE